MNDHVVFSCVHLSLNEQGNPIDMDGASLQELAQDYSLMKFGHPDALERVAARMVKRICDELVNGEHLGPLVRNVGDDPAYFYLTSPGIRNVHSAASLLARSLMFGINEHLTQLALPTFIHKPLTRLASGSADYATLDADSRRNREKTTKTLLPVSDFKEQPIHVLFIDDAWVTGTTARRARDRALAAGARSCHQLVAIKVDEEVAKEDSAIEDRLNRSVIHGGLDANVAGIINHPHFEPVQRLLRLVLHPQNREDLPGFCDQLDVTGLLKVYRSALANDYLWIRPEEGQGERQQHGFYGESLHQLGGLLRGRSPR